MPKKIVFSEEQIKELRDLVEQGIRQAEIAKHFSVTDDTVRRICKENSIDVKMPHKCVCIICGQEFRSNRKDAKTCNKDHYRNCVVCGAEFLVDRWNIKETCSIKCESQLKYGVDHYLQANEIKDKRKQTLQEKYGVQNVSQLDFVKEKVKQTNLEKYGKRSSLPKVPRKAKKFTLGNFGLDLSIQNKNFGLKFEELLKANNIDYEPEFSIESYSYDFKCGNYLIEIDPTATHNSAISIFPNTSPTDPRYHLNKSQLAQEHGFQCIHVFDWDDWNRILLLIKPKKHIYARKCKVVEVDKKTAEEFTAKYHIQGSCIGQNLNVGLEYEGELIQVMTFGKPRYSRKYDLELLRLCSISTVRVIGGASKLFKHFTQLHPDKSILSYCNLSKFNGKVYEEIGMKLDHVSEPAKVWSKKNEYITDNYLRQRGFDQIFHTDFGKGSSNEQLMIDHKWLPVYDCGQKVFIW